jgi:hypothetical protein
MLFMFCIWSTIKKGHYARQKFNVSVVTWEILYTPFYLDMIIILSGNMVIALGNCNILIVFYDCSCIVINDKRSDHCEYYFSVILMSLMMIKVRS